MASENYDPMVDFQKRGIDFLFKQGVAVVISVLFLGITIFAVYVMWTKMDDMTAKYDAKIARVNSDWSTEVADVRRELRHCVAQKDTLIEQYTAMAFELAGIKAKQQRIIRSQRNSPIFGVKD